MRETILKKLAYWHASYPWRMIFVTFILTVVFGAFASQLKVTLRWSDLLPSRDRRTVQFNKIIDEFATATSLVVVVQGEEQRIKAFAEKLAPSILELIDSSKNPKIQLQVEKLKEKIEKLESEKNEHPEIEKLRSEIKSLEAQIDRKLFQRVDYKTEVDFLKNHGLMLIKEDDLENIKDIFLDPNLTGLLVNLNNSMEKEYIGREESISTREKEDQAVMFLDGIQELIETLHKAATGNEPQKEEIHAVVDKLLLGEPYFLSYDKKALVLNAIPNFSMMDIGLVVLGTDAVQAQVDKLLLDFPDVKAGLTGFIAIGRDEMVYSKQSLGYTTVIALIAILILLIISFRMWVAPVFATVNLMVGLVWAVGTASIVVGQLNIMTQMMGVILLGLGIDFSIHLISGFTEWRAAGDTIASAMEKSFLKSGKGIITGALTTAFAFLTLIISHSRGMKEMGIVTGTGLLAILFSTMIFLPSLLVLRERYIERKLVKKALPKQKVQRDITFRFLGKSCKWLSKHYVFTLMASLIITFILIWSGSKIQFDQNYMNMEPEGLTSIVLQDAVLDKFDMSMDYALVLTDDVDQSREFAKKFRKLSSVAITEDLSIYLPSNKEQQNRIPHIMEIMNKLRSIPVKSAILPEEVQEITSQIDRLRMNIMEMQDMAYLGGQDKVDNKCKEIVGDPALSSSRNMILELKNLLEARSSLVADRLTHFQDDFAPYFKTIVTKMCNTSLICLEDLPESILDRYSNSARNQFLITVFPAGNVWQDAEFLKQFVQDLESVSDRATGMPPVFRALIEVVIRDGRKAMLLTIVVIFLLLCADFRNPRYALIAMLPLIAGVFWMVGLMNLLGLQLTVMNVLGLPMIIGIGIDDGVHIVHRWHHEGKNKVRVIFSSTGKAILLTSLTTMLAFGSLVFSIWRGFGHLGGALFIGVAACFLATVIILAGIIGLTERRHRITEK